MKTQIYYLALTLIALVFLIPWTQSWAGQTQQQGGSGQITGGENGFGNATHSEKAGLTKQTGISGSIQTHTSCGGEHGFSAQPPSDFGGEPTSDGNPGGRGGEYGFDVIISVLGLIWSAIP
jgi:hypothetical protein